MRRPNDALELDALFDAAKTVRDLERHRTDGGRAYRAMPHSPAGSQLFHSTAQGERGRGSLLALPP
jgi:hypothetical protein